MVWHILLTHGLTKRGGGEGVQIGQKSCDRTRLVIGRGQSSSNYGQATEFLGLFVYYIKSSSLYLLSISYII